MNGSTALLVVDVQTAMMEDHPYEEVALIDNIGRTIAAFRNAGLEVVYVRHDGGAGDPLQAGTPGWQIYNGIAPAEGEKIFDKRVCSAFKDTGLHEYLRDRDIRTLVVMGMQTEYCVDTTVKVAFELGYKVLVPEGTTSTYNNGVFAAKDLIDFYTQRIWNNRFAKIVKPDELGQICRE